MNGDDKVRPGALIRRELWGSVKTVAFDKKVNPAVLVERYLEAGLKGEECPAGEADAKIRGDQAAQPRGGRRG